MHIGDIKGKILDETIISLKGSHASDITCVEIGSYCGYSAVRIAKNLTGNDKLVCIESHPECVKWTKRMVELANMTSFVEVLGGALIDVLDMLKSVSSRAHLLFIDHDKLFYLSDLKLMESSGLLKSGSVVIADNILMFPMEDYLNHVRDPTGLYSQSTLYRSVIEYSTVDSVDPGEPFEDGVEVSVVR